MHEDTQWVSVNVRATVCLIKTTVSLSAKNGC